MATSTNQDNRYQPSQFIPTVIVYDNDLDNQNPQIDVFNPANIKTRKLLQSVGKYRIYHDKLPVVARRQLGNTTCWWMLAMMNGINHALTIDAGELIDLPNIDLIRNALLVQPNTSTNRIPTVTVI